MGIESESIVVVNRKRILVGFKRRADAGGVEFVLPSFGIMNRTRPKYAWVWVGVCSARQVAGVDFPSVRGPGGRGESERAEAGGGRRRESY